MRHLWKATWGCSEAGASQGKKPKRQVEEEEENTSIKHLLVISEKSLLGQQPWTPETQCQSVRTKLSNMDQWLSDLVLGSFQCSYLLYSKALFAHFRAAVSKRGTINPARLPALYQIQSLQCFLLLCFSPHHLCALKRENIFLSLFLVYFLLWISASLSGIHKRLFIRGNEVRSPRQ